MFKSLFSTKAKERAERQLREQPDTGCEELDAEIAAIDRRNRLESSLAQIQNDLVFARKVNEQEYTEAEELVECGCCFGDYPWDDMTSCTAGHLVCYQCVTHTAQECAFGQGDNTYDPRGLKCIAASNEKCNDVIPTRILERVLAPDLLTRYTTRIMATELETANLNLVRCPFCMYAEFKDPPIKIRLRAIFRHIAVVILFFITLLFPFFVTSITVPFHHSNLLHKLTCI
jgi:hypothetical protein